LTSWWCKNNQCSTDQSENITFQTQKHFQFVFDKVIKILMKFKGQSIFDKKFLENDQDVLYAYCCSKISNEQIHQKIGNWITSNQEKFLGYFTARAKKPNAMIKELLRSFYNFIRFISYFDLALSFNLEDEKISQCVASILKKKETEIPPLLLFKLILLGVEKNHHTAYKRIEGHFFKKFDHYLLLLRNDQFWQNNNIPSSTKLRPARVLKQLKLTEWEKQGWEKAAFKDYEKSFSIKPFSNVSNLVDQNLLDAQKKWIFEELEPRIVEFRLWQKLRFEKMPTSIFRQIFSQDHLKILKNYIQSQNKPEACINDIGLFCHQDLYPDIKQWVRNLKKRLKQIPDNKKEASLINILIFLSISKIVLDLSIN